ncbi:MAG: sporulation initiation factor Spo0A C-terminal domain-containing protein [Clostridiales bacterium]|nr:sporulation initiation factor Spo0A C-terminal domain-containing protein [Clostridiales bacterium]
MDVYERVLDLLRPLGITEKYIGAKQLIQAIEIVLKCPGSLHAIQKEIYDVIALQYSVSGGAVERNLRMVSQKAWETDSQYMENLAGYPMAKRPTASQLIEIILHSVQRMQ